MKPQRLLLLAALAGLAGCGRVAELKPPPGHAMPVKPLMARTTPTVQQLLARSPIAKPDRVDELITRSQPRPLDPFDLPPPTGGAAESRPAGTDPQPVSNETGPVTPGE
jgi:predicted small lipoprotein YifL